LFCRLLLSVNPVQDGISLEHQHKPKRQLERWCDKAGPDPVENGTLHDSRAHGVTQTHNLLNSGDRATELPDENGNRLNDSGHRTSEDAHRAALLGTVGEGYPAPERQQSNLDLFLHDSNVAGHAARTDALARLFVLASPRLVGQLLW